MCSASDHAQGVKKELYCENLPVVIVDYHYDSLGRRDRVDTTGQAFVGTPHNAYGYNARSELEESKRYSGNTDDPLQLVNAEYRKYLYDPIGNRTSATEGASTSAKQLTYTANQLNQYTLIASPVEASPGYDADGNLTTAPAGIAGAADTVLKYDAENRLISVEPQAPAGGSTKVEYVYDYMSRCTAKKVFAYTGGAWSLQSTSTFIYDGWNLICENKTPAGGTPTPVYYVWGLDLSGTLQGAGGVGGLLARVKDGAAQQYTFDGNGNVAQLISSAGAIVAQYEYDPYGNAIVATGDNPFRFSTKFFDDETGLLYYGYRYYSPVLGRWLNRDPIGEDGGYNLYGFVQNNPVDLIDILGLTDPQLGIAIMIEFGWDSVSKKPSYSIGLAGSASQGLCDNLKFKADVNYRFYKGGLGTNGGFGSDISASMYASIGEGKGTPSPQYTLNYQTRSALKDTYQDSFTWGQTWNYNSAVGPTRVGFIGVKSNSFFAQYNNDAVSFPTFGGDTDYGWTAGVILGLSAGGGNWAEIGPQVFTGEYLNRERENQAPIGNRMHYIQTQDQKGLNRSDWYFRYAGNYGGVTASIVSPEWLNVQHLVHDKLHSPQLARFQYAQNQSYGFSFSLMGEVRVKK